MKKIWQLITGTILGVGQIITSAVSSTAPNVDQRMPSLSPPPRYSKLQNIQADDPLYLLHANDIQAQISESQSAIQPLAHRSHSSHSSHSSHGSHASHTSHYSSVTPPSVSANQAPVAYNMSIATSEDTSVSFKLQATDINNNHLAYWIITRPNHGVITLQNNSECIYTPNPDFYGSDSFTFKAYDGSLSSKAAEVRITVNPSNDAPVAQEQSIIVLKNTPKTIKLNAFDPDGDNLLYTISANPVHGKLTGKESIYSYTPENDYIGPDSFTFKVSDGKLDSNPATITIAVRESNSIPTVESDNIHVNINTPKTITLQAFDGDNDKLTYAVIKRPSHGKIQWTIGSQTVIYKPDRDYIGTDSLTYTVSDGFAYANTATISLTVGI